MREEKYIPYLLFLPSFFLVIFIAYYPLIWGINLSFYHIDLSNLLKGGEFTGLTNYFKLFQDPIFYSTIWRTLIYVSATIPLRFIVGLILKILNSNI